MITPAAAAAVRQIQRRDRRPAKSSRSVADGLDGSRSGTADPRGLRLAQRDGIEVPELANLRCLPA
jgi:hypothetical protein